MPDDPGPVWSEPTAPAFAGFIGRGVKVAVIDSGVHPGHPHIGPMAGGVAITARGEVQTGEAAFLDRLGHGTAVTAAIQEKAPGASCYAVKVFDDALRTTATALVAAMDWCADNGMDIANLSLGSTHPRHEAAFAQAARRAEAAGVLLIAARSADGAPCYPGCLPAVLGVELDWDCPRDSCRRGRLDGKEVLYASGFPRPIPGVEPSRNLYGVSFAAANMTGLAARAWEAVGPGHGGRRPLLVREALERGFQHPASAPSFR
jgi:subtilisin family serine protease